MKLHFLAMGLLAMLASGESIAQASPALARYYIDASRVPGDTGSAWSLARLFEVVAPNVPGSADAARQARAANPIGSDDAPALLAVRLFDSKQPFSDIERASALQSMLDAAAGNGYFAVLLMAVPEFKDDPEASDRLMSLAAHAPRYEGGYTDRVAALFDRLSRLPPPPVEAGDPTDVDPDDVRLVMAIALTAADWGPAWTYAMRRCKVATGVMLDDCRALGQRVVDDGDTLMETMMGAALLRMTATTSEQRGQAESTRRLMMWRQEMGGPERRLSPSDDRRDMALYRKILFAEGELAAIDAMLRSRGLPLTPPVGWTSRYGADG